MWGGRFFPTDHLPATNYLSFQQHYRFQHVTIFVFYNIPAWARAAVSRSFVFIDIPAPFVHFLKLQQPPLSLTRTTCCPIQSSVQKVLPAPATLRRTSGQVAGGKRCQQGAKQFIIHNFRIGPFPVPCNPPPLFCLLPPESCSSRPTTYDLPHTGAGC